MFSDNNNTKLTPHRLSRRHGAVLIELAISIPLLLAIFFGGLWFIVLQNVQSQLEHVVSNAPFAAITRSNPLLFDPSTSPPFDGAAVGAIDNFISNPSAGTLPPLLFHYKNANLGDATTAFILYSGNGWAEPDDATTPVTQPAAYMLAYAYEGLRLGIGPTLSYPCLPEEHAGCALCKVYYHSIPDPKWITQPPIAEMTCSASIPDPFYTLFNTATRLLGGSGDYGMFVRSASTFPGADGGTGGSGPIG